jgi:hypothetical protein
MPRHRIRDLSESTVILKDTLGVINYDYLWPTSYSGVGSKVDTQDTKVLAHAFGVRGGKVKKCRANQKQKPKRLDRYW